MILVDTSIWVDHFRKADTGLQSLLASGQVTTHPFVIGEIALGNLPRHDPVIRELQRLPTSRMATDGEVLSFIRSKDLSGTGIGLVDAHLLASVLLSPGDLLWTRDKRLHRMAGKLGVASAPT
jgi:predicted nucleic acid-binding protein